MSKRNKNKENICFHKGRHKCNNSICLNCKIKIPECCITFCELCDFMGESKIYCKKCIFKVQNYCFVCKNCYDNPKYLKIWGLSN